MVSVKCMNAYVGLTMRKCKYHTTGHPAKWEKRSFNIQIVTYYTYHYLYPWVGEYTQITHNLTNKINKQLL